MRFDASLKRLQQAVQDLEKASKKAASSRKNTTQAGQIDMFAAPMLEPSNDIDVETLKKQLDNAISSVETLMKESA